MKNELEQPIFKDERGEIRRFNLFGVKYNLLFTKAGIFRSGDYHSVKQYDIILKGTFEITLRKNNKDETLIKKANEFVVIPANTPHLFKSVTDTVMLEWWDGDFNVKYYKPYRQIIEKQIEKLKK